MKKKTILFIMESLSIGGAEKSLVTILNMIDYSKYDVDLFLFDYGGEFMEYIPNQVNLLPKDEKFSIFGSNRKLSPLKYFLKLDFKSCYHSLCWLFGVLFSKLNGQQLYIGWNHIKYLFNDIDKEYDTSIAFLERKSIYFNVDKVKAKNKIGFIHNNYDMYPFDYKADRQYFKYYNHIATVSNTCLDALRKYFPEYSNKFLVIKNMVSKKLIRDMAKEKIDVVKNEDEIWIVTVGRLVHQKGLDNAIDVCDILVNKMGYNIKWRVLGEGEERVSLTNKIKQKGLEDNFILMGATKNPYKWIAKSDIYVTTSRFEGYAVTVLEAKALAMPIVGNNIKEIAEQIEDGKNGFLGNSNEEIADKIKILIDNQNIRNKFINNLENDNTIENKEELEKIYKLL